MPDDLPGKVPDGGILLIDWDCSFCQGSKAWIERRDKRQRVVFRALDSEEGRAWLRRCGRDPEDRSTVVLVQLDDGEVRCTDRSTAVLRTLWVLPWPYRGLAVGLVVPRPIRDLVYKWVSHNRHRWPFR